MSSSGDSDDLSIGFHRIIEARERKLTTNKRTKGNYYFRIFLKDVIGFAGHQDNCAYGLGYILTLQSSDNHVIGYPAGANGAANLASAGRVIKGDTSWYVPHYTPNMSNQKSML